MLVRLVGRRESRPDRRVPVTQVSFVVSAIQAVFREILIDPKIPLSCIAITGGVEHTLVHHRQSAGNIARGGSPAGAGEQLRRRCHGTGGCAAARLVACQQFSAGRVRKVRRRPGRKRRILK